jgi:hypothetical protein
MSERFLAEGEPWVAVSAALGRPGRRRAYLAIGFVSRTAEELLDLKPGDVLVCDASVPAIKMGATDPPVLKRLVNAGVVVHSCAGLHAKCVVVGKTAWVGSANASRSSSRRLIEAALQVTSSDTVGEVRDWIQDLAQRSPRLTAGDLDDLERYRPKLVPQPPAPYQKLPVPTTSKKLHLAEFLDHASARAHKAAEQSFQSARQEARRASARLGALDWFEWEEGTVPGPGDWLIDVTPGQRLSRPVWILATTRLGRDHAVVWTIKSEGGTIPRRSELLAAALGNVPFPGDYVEVRPSQIKRVLSLYHRP